MSAEHVAWVYRHSPATGATFQVHHAIADSVNDQYHHEFWMKLGKLARKARVQRGTASKAVGWLRANGLLELVDEVEPTEASRAVRYRFVFPDLPVLYDSRAVPTERAPGATGARTGARRSRTQVRADRAPIEPKLGTQVEPNANVPPPAGAAPAQIDKLCAQLADAIRQHRGGKGRPTISAAWKRDMRLLLERGPLGVDDLNAVEPERVSAAITTLFTELNEPSSDGFCWADVVQSPNALRRHWPKLREATRKARAQRVGKGAAAIERNAARRNGELPNREPLFPALGAGAVDVKEVP